jgi:hypothetical protein
LPAHLPFVAGGPEATKGAILLPKTDVTEVIIEGGKVIGVQTTKGPVQASVVVDAAEVTTASASISRTSLVAPWMSLLVWDQRWCSRPTHEALSPETYPHQPTRKSGALSDLALSAPSMKAALEAWGAENDLFHRA